MEALDFYSPLLTSHHDTNTIEFEFKSLPDATVCKKTLSELGLRVTWHPIRRPFQESYSFSATTSKVEELYKEHGRQLDVSDVGTNANPIQLPVLVIDSGGIECVPS